MIRKPLLVLGAAAILVGGYLGSRSRDPAVVVKPAVSAAAVTTYHPRLPSPRIPRTERNQAEPDLPPSRMTMMLNGEELPNIKIEQLDGYLASNQRSAASLLTAHRLTHDPDLLREANEKYPDDPRVAYESWFRTQDLATRQQLLDKWEKGDSNNALVAYLSAANLFKSGNNDAALGKIQEAAEKAEFSYFGKESVLDAEEAYRAAGYSDTEAKAASSMELLLPHLAEMKGISISLVDLAAAYRANGDSESVQAVMSVGLQMAQKISNGHGSIIEDLVSSGVENILLRSMEPDFRPGVTGKTVQELMSEAKARREQLKAIGRDTEALLPNLSEADVSAYFDRVRLTGEQQASLWLKQKFGNLPPSSPSPDSPKSRLQ